VLQLNSCFCKPTAIYRKCTVKLMVNTCQITKGESNSRHQGRGNILNQVICKTSSRTNRSTRNTSRAPQTRSAKTQYTSNLTVPNQIPKLRRPHDVKKIQSARRGIDRLRTRRHQTIPHPTPCTSQEQTCKPR
jgi:hypothetical protein